MIKLRDNRRILCGCRTGHSLIFDIEKNSVDLISTSNEVWIEELQNVDKETFASCSKNYLQIWKY